MNAVPWITLAALLAAALVYYNYWSQRKRTEALKQAARILGFDFFPPGDDALLASLPGFHLLSLGRATELTNLMRGARGPTPVAIFDYSYVTGGGKSRRRWRQSVICFHTNKQFPTNFCLRPEHAWHKIAAVFGYQDIDFENRPRFSAKYLLRSDNEQAVRLLFTDEVLAYFEQDGVGICTEGAGDWLVVYRESARVEPDAIASFMEEGIRVLSLFQR